MTRYVVTLPPSLDEAGALAFVRLAKERGAHLLEIRNDLYDRIALAPLKDELPLLVSERSGPLAADWTEHASLVDRETWPGEGDAIPPVLLSFHSATPMSTEEAVNRWTIMRTHTAHGIKHVEPLSDPRDGVRLFQTQRALMDLFGKERVTVLATGPLALPFRAILAERNALDYVALDKNWSAAMGQRRLDDAIRAGHGGGARFGILGNQIAHSLSPEIHSPPFDRIDLPSDTDLRPLLTALHPFYEGFAVTSPFKQQAARACGSERAAVNTLVRDGTGYRGTSTDVDGALEALMALGANEVHVLGEGGVASSLMEAGERLKVRVTFHSHRSLAGAQLGGVVIWTWPPGVEPPAGLRLDGAKVATIAYGDAALPIVRRIRALGATPIELGEEWLRAQARAQRAFWISSAP